MELRWYVRSKSSHPSRPILLPMQNWLSWAAASKSYVTCYSRTTSLSAWGRGLSIFSSLAPSSLQFYLGWFSRPNSGNDDDAEEAEADADAVVRANLHWTPPHKKITSISSHSFPTFSNQVRLSIWCWTADIFTGRSAEAGLDLTLWLSHSVSQQNPNELFREF